MVLLLFFLERVRSYALIWPLSVLLDENIKLLLNLNDSRQVLYFYRTKLRVG